MLPANNSFSKKVYIRTSINATKRFLFIQNSWIKWWPSRLQDDLATSDKKENDSYLYTLQNAAYTGVDIAVKKNENKFKTFAELLQVSKDSILVTWSFQLPGTKNPFKKISNYFYTKTLKKDADDILENLKAFLENKDNIYGISIKQTIVTDTALIAKKYASISYPSTEVIYSLIQQLQNYIISQNAVQINPPMLHIKYDSGVYKTMVAIPVNKEFPGNDTFLLKRMFPGKILVTQVKGGIYTTENALRQLDTYLDDYQLTSPAIPFESLITNRMEVHDTSKWITKVYYPIF